ncbi:A disintegrin and metalloproteinase with thrombospondin motifs 4-like [Haliotis asinina]|uniref:A disintegrin and metalloproteinase with thrombospondin motifs 4-like n=1 Tax=Haliotis asinina TaxID=109174 RepID=UPI003531EBAC
MEQRLRGRKIQVTAEDERRKFFHDRERLTPDEAIAQMDTVKEGEGQTPWGFPFYIGNGLDRQLNDVNHLVNDGVSHHVKHSRVKRQAVGNHVIELVVFLDYPLYLFWLQRNAGNVDATLAEMVDYYANTINSVNRRLATLTRPGFTIQLAVNAFTVATVPDVVSWTSLLNSSNIVDANSSLAAFEAFLSSQGGAINGIPYDHSMTITGFDLARGGANASVGLANILVCNPASGSIHEDVRSEALGVIIANGIGRALSARTDGELNLCSSNDNFIMSQFIQSPPAIRASNPWIYSTCSSDSVQTYLQTPAAACTLTLSGAPINLAPFLVPEFGQKYPADVQCQLYYGPGSKFCRQLYFTGARTFDNMCHEFFCLFPGDGNCYPNLAHDGTTCGNRKFCQQGLCVFSLAAPATPERCPAGDDPTVTCDPALCSVAPAAVRDQLCCATCKPVVTAFTLPPTNPAGTTASMMAGPTGGAPRAGTTASMMAGPTGGASRVGTTASMMAGPTGGAPRAGTTASMMAGPTRQPAARTTASMFSAVGGGGQGARTTASVFPVVA